MMVEYKLPIITVNPDGSLRGKGGLLEDEAVEFAKMLDAAGIDMIQVAQANHTGNMGDQRIVGRAAFGRVDLFRRLFV